MRALVVYESWFGNTERIAQQVGRALQDQGDVEIVSVDDPLPSLEGVDLLVLGAPTHVHGLSSRRSREGAIDQGGQGEVGIGMRGFLEALPNGAGGPHVASFDTRADKPVWLVGSAARGIARRLREHGYTPAAEPESFFVDGTPGPLTEGELERAAQWGKALADAVVHVAA